MLRRNAGIERKRKAYLQLKAESMVTVSGKAKVFPMFAPDSLNPIARFCFAPNLSESKAFATGRCTPWKRPTRNLRVNISTKPAALLVNNVATP